MAAGTGGGSGVRSDVLFCVVVFAPDLEGRFRRRSHRIDELIVVETWELLEPLKQRPISGCTLRDDAAASDAV